MIQYTDAGMFLDEAEITVHGGDGGNGLVSWRREKYVARGGPYGGDGGDGGDVIFKADANADTLSAFAQTKVFHGEDGERGKRARMAGKDGEDVVLNVPPGTVIFDISPNRETGSGKREAPALNRSAATGSGGSETIVADLAKDGDEVIVVKGGRGGYGNAHFASSVRRAPDFAEKGEPGEERRLKLELKLVADVGIIGLPSTGKSTLISVISAARPKIADYPFTTLVPNLGVVHVGYKRSEHSKQQAHGKPTPSERSESRGRSFVVCDVPGLIEGASEGKGLGDKFLRHIERCGVLVHLLDVHRPDIVADYRTIRGELERYSSVLAQKRELVVLNKIDLVGNATQCFEEKLKKDGIGVFAAISAATHRNVAGFLKKLFPIVLEERTTNKRPPAAVPPIIVLRPHLTSERAGAFVIGEREPGVFTVRGKRIGQIASMTDWDNPAAVRRFRNIAERTGLRQALQSAGAGEESVVMIGAVDVGKHWL